MAVNYDFIAILLLGANIDQYRSWIPAARPIILTFSLIVTLYLQKLKPELEKL